MKLTDLKPGEVGSVIRVGCGFGIERKMFSRGIIKGRRIKMVSGSRGPVVIECEGTQMAMGRGMARRVEVRKE